MPYGTLNVDKIVNDNGETFAGLYGFKNRIINGAMVIDQRNAGASVTITANNAAFTLDRFRCDAPAGQSITVQRSTVAPAGFTNSLLFTAGTASTNAGDVSSIQQFIEGFNTADLGWGAAGAQSVTISFWVRSSLTGNFGLSLRNSAANRTYVAAFNISAANTFEYKTLTIPGDTSGTWLTDNGRGIVVMWDMGVGTTNSIAASSAWGTSGIGLTGGVKLTQNTGATFYITGVQLEKGSTATSFDYRPYGTELMLCQRYFEKSFNQNTAPANGPSGTAFATDSNPVAVISQGNIVNTSYRFMVVKRTAPTLTYYGNSTGQLAVASNGTGVVWTTVAGNISAGTTEIGIAAYNGTSTIQHLTFAFAASAEL